MIKTIIAVVITGMVMTVWGIGTHMSGDTNSMMIGVLLGVFAPLPFSIIMLLATSGRRCEPVAQVERHDRLVIIEQVPTVVQNHAQRLNGIAQWNGDCWLIIDPNSGRRLATQRKQLTG